MKKSLIFAALSLLFISTYDVGLAQSLTIKNNSGCTVAVEIQAHDIYGTCPGVFKSNLITLVSGATVSYANVAALNGNWVGGLTAVAGAGSGWDGVTVSDPSVFSCATSVGVCGGLSTSATLSCSSCVPAQNVTWSTMGANTGVVIN